jgi:diguanylate cyclase (GGDEF)-like protein
VSSQPGRESVERFQLEPQRSGRDDLTGLLTRRDLYDLVAAEDPSTSQVAGVLVASVARFGRINDIWGPSYGDRCLSEVAAWLTDISAEDDLVARLSGNQFVIVYGPDSTVPVQLRDAGERILQVGAQQISVSIFAGWSARRPRQPLAEVLRQALIALAAAKQRSWRSVVQWSAPISSAAAGELRDEERVRKAISAADLTVWFQPIVDVGSRSVVSIEALARITPAPLSLPAERFVELSRRLGLSPAFARLTFHSAFTNGALLADVFPGADISVNVSRDLLGAGNAVELVAEAATGAGIALSAVIIELTEHAASGISHAALVAMTRRCVQLGMKVFIDDFGKGETSLSLLRSLPVSAIKLDRSLIPSDEDGEGWQFLAGVVAMLQSLSTPLIAEGIETRAQSVRLAELAIPLQQGYLFGRPQNYQYWQANPVLFS